MMRLNKYALAGLALLALGGYAAAQFSPVNLLSSVGDNDLVQVTPNAGSPLITSAKMSTLAAYINVGQARATCSGTTTATCQGVRFTASVTGLTTAAAGNTSAAMTVTNATVVSSAYIVQCQVNGYAGTGQPVVTGVIPGTGNVSFTITNVAASGSLNATVAVACEVF